MNWLADLGHFGRHCAALSWRLVTPPWFVESVAFHTWGLVWRCLVPVVAVVFPFGMVVALQALNIFDLFGAQRLLSPLISVAIFRELAPVLASVLVAAQGGSSIAAELGAMRIHEELDATEVMSIDSLRVHVAPRVLALLLATPMLALMGAGAGILGGATTAILIEGEPSGPYWNNLWDLTAGIDIFGGVFKAWVFGWIIAMVATYQGFHATGGAAGVGRAVNNAVVQSITSFIFANYLLTSALFGAIGE